MTSWERDRSRRKKLCTSVLPLVPFLLTFCSRGPTFSFCTEPCKLWCSPCLRGLLSDYCLSVTMLWGSPSHTERACVGVPPKPSLWVLPAQVKEIKPPGNSIPTASSHFPAPANFQTPPSIWVFQLRLNSHGAETCHSHDGLSEFLTYRIYGQNKLHSCCFLLLRLG